MLQWSCRMSWCSRRNCIIFHPSPCWHDKYDSPQKGKHIITTNICLIECSRRSPISDDAIHFTPRTADPKKRHATLRKQPSPISHYYRIIISPPFPPPPLSTPDNPPPRIPQHISQLRPSHRTLQLHHQWVFILGFYSGTITGSQISFGYRGRTFRMHLGWFMGGTVPFSSGITHGICCSGTIGLWTN